MQDYSFLRAAKVQPPVTAAARSSFKLAMAEMHERKAVEWAEMGDEIQAQRWLASAASLRGEA